MADWYLNRALTNFRSAVNARYPNRDKASDGTVGDDAHQATSSDHNPDPAGEPDAGSVDAWDMDVDLRSGNDAAAIERLKAVFQAHESSRYWIHNRQIASRSTGWRRDPYTGPNPHERHVHWNTRESHEASTVPWLLPPEPSGDTMLLIKTNDSNTVWRSDGVQRAAMTDPNALAALRAAGHPLVVVDTEAQLADAAGPVWTPPGEPVPVEVDMAEVVAAVKQALREGTG